MNRGGLGWLDSTGRMQIPVDLLESIGVVPGHRLYGVYYPVDLSRSSDNQKTVSHDFILTPVPFRQWNRCAHMVLRINHEPGALCKVTELLAREGVSVAISEATRSGYRFATWNTHIVFEKASPGEFDPELSVYRGIHQAAAELEQKLESAEYSDVLFRERVDLYLADPVDIFAQTALAYFHHISTTHGSDDVEGGWLYKPFEVECAEDGTLLSDRGDLNAILTSILGKDDGTFWRTRVITALDTRLANIRLSVLPNNRLHRFAELIVGYKRSGRPDVSSGVIHTIAAKLGPRPGTTDPEFNIWRTYTGVGPSEPSYESGSSYFLIEDVSKEEYSSWDDLWHKLVDRLPKGTLVKRVPRIQLDEPFIHPLRYGYKDPDVIRSRSRPHGYTVFISYNGQDQAVAEDLVKRLEQEAIDVYWYGMETSGQLFPEKIRDRIRSADEMCILCSKASLASVWVTTEWGAAWALGTYIVPILIDVEASALPTSLNTRVALRQDDLARYVQEVVARRGHPRSRAHL